ncbi:hypothetical protein ACFQ7N_28080 [Streptomyces niveus]|uniref:hypothetical protein n=1 Tax=Streptomyces niveus TaxID=193462 RepID=UPI0036757034
MRLDQAPGQSGVYEASGDCQGRRDVPPPRKAEKVQQSWMQAEAKKSLIVVAACIALTVCGFFGYQQIFTKGIDLLPSRPCAGAVDRSLVADALPDVRTADERGKITDSVNNQYRWAR